MLKRLHLVSGLLFVVAFLLTGQYMDIYQDHLSGMADGPRMLYRTRHIFILLSGLLNLGLGVYFSRRSQPWRRALQAVGSALIVTAPVLFVVAFFYEPGLRDLHTPLSHWATYMLAAGTILHLLSAASE